MKDDRSRFVHPGTTPPVGYVYEILHEGELFSFQAPMWTTMVKRLREWYSAKALDWPGEAEMRKRVEHFICQLVPPGFCAGGPASPRIPFLSISAIRDASKLFVDRVIRGQGSLVPNEEAVRRAKICANCPRNTHGICTSCASSEFHDLFAWLVRQGRRTPYDSVLDVCTACGCVLKAKVHISIDTLARLTPHSYPENCWLHGTKAHVPEAKGETHEYRVPTA